MGLMGTLPPMMLRSARITLPLVLQSAGRVGQRGGPRSICSVARTSTSKAQNDGHLLQQTNEGALEFGNHGLFTYINKNHRMFLFARVHRSTFVYSGFLFPDLRCMLVIPTQSDTSRWR